MELSPQLAGIKLEHPIMNAAGTCKSLDDVRRLAYSPVAAIVVGSITKEDRPGNTGATYWYEESLYSLNSIGLKNPGSSYYKEHLPAMVAIAHGCLKPLIVSVAGFSPEEYVDLTMVALLGGADMVEVNLGCPNVWAGSEQKRIACFNLESTWRTLSLLENSIPKNAKLAVKISPFSDPFALGELAAILGNSKVVSVVTTTNTFPNAFLWGDGGKPRITQDLAGFAGPAMKPIGLGQVRQLRALLPKNIQIIGVGGITSGIDAADYLRCGATAVQVGTHYFGKGEKVFGTLLEELVDTHLLD